MARTDSTKTLWRVQVRKSQSHKWQNKGLYETREAAREIAARFRVGWFFEDLHNGTVVGFGNTRVVKHIRGEKK